MSSLTYSPLVGALLVGVLLFTLIKSAFIAWGFRLVGQRLGFRMPSQRLATFTAWLFYLALVGYGCTIIGIGFKLDDVGSLDDNAARVLDSFLPMQSHKGLWRITQVGTILLMLTGVTYLKNLSGSRSPA